MGGALFLYHSESISQATRLCREADGGGYSKIDGCNEATSKNNAPCPLSL
eukprot:m.184460 g.184460  ORF g.184460 m.184460 type:complete len:50 (-) comp15391_c0_seq33:900-1049(-)